MIVVRLQKHAFPVLELGVRQLVFLGECPLDVANCALDALDVGGDALIALAADADRPFHGGAGTDLAFEVRTDLRQVIGEQEGCAGAVGAVHDGDFRIRQIDARIEGGNFRRIPLGDLAEVDVGGDRPGQLHLARGDAVDVDHGDDSAHDGRKLHQAFRLQFVALERHVRRAEVDRLCLDLLDAGARADRLVIKAVAGGGLVRLGPFGVNRVRKRRSRPRHVRRHCRRQSRHRRDCRYCHCGACHSIQGPSHVHFYSFQLGG